EFRELAVAFPQFVRRLSPMAGAAFCGSVDDGDGLRSRAPAAVAGSVERNAGEGWWEMRVLVTAASKHGATFEIAEVIARVLDEHGLSTELVAIEEVHDLRRYEAVVLGSAVYMGQWLKQARGFVDAHASELAQRPTWLFSSG